MKERDSEKVSVPCEHCFRKGFVYKSIRCPEKTHLNCDCKAGFLQVKHTCIKCWGGGFRIVFRKVPTKKGNQS